MDWRFSTFLLFLVALLFGFTWATSQNGLCHSKFMLDVLALQNKDGALNCFDFWFNRYQTAIAGLSALATALIAAALVSKQIDRADAANEISRRGQAAAQYAAVYDRYIKLEKNRTFISALSEIKVGTDNLYFALQKVADEAEIADLQRRLVGLLDQAITFSQTIENEFDCGPIFADRARGMEWECVLILQIIAPEHRFAKLVTSNVSAYPAVSMLRIHSMIFSVQYHEFFVWFIGEIARTKKLLVDLDHVITGSRVR